MKVNVPDTTEKALEAVKKALDVVKYGEIIIKMQDGKSVWVDKYERERGWGKVLNMYL